MTESVNAGKARAGEGCDVLDIGDWVGAEGFVGRGTEIAGCPLSQAQKIKIRNRMADKLEMNRVGRITYNRMGYENHRSPLF
jgi:hypothetical protein